MGSKYSKNSKDSMDSKDSNTSLNPSELKDSKISNGLSQPNEASNSTETATSSRKRPRRPSRAGTALAITRDSIAIQVLHLPNYGMTSDWEDAMVLSKNAKGEYSVYVSRYLTWEDEIRYHWVNLYTKRKLKTLAEVVEAADNAAAGYMNCGDHRWHQLIDGCYQLGEDFALDMLRTYFVRLQNWENRQKAERADYQPATPPPNREGTSFAFSPEPDTVEVHYRKKAYAWRGPDRSESILVARNAKREFSVYASKRDWCETNPDELWAKVFERQGIKSLWDLAEALRDAQVALNLGWPHLDWVNVCYRLGKLDPELPIEFFKAHREWAPDRERRDKEERERKRKGYQ